MWAQALCERIFPLLLDMGARGVAILLLTTVAAMSLRRASAAARHWVWFLGVASLLVLPILSTALPGWHVLPALPRRASGLAAMTKSEMVEQAPEPPPIVQSPSTSDDVQTPLSPQIVPSGIPAAKEDFTSAQSIATPPVVPPQPVAASTPHHLDWAAWAVVLWLVGCAVQLGSVAMGLASLCWLGRRSSRITDRSWAILLEDLQKHLRLRRRVTLLGHGGRTMPMTWGLHSVRVLLPEDSAGWNAEQRKAVLLHELSHAKRWDCLTQLVAQIVCGIYWFNPLVWFAWKQMQSERERACDDLVLSTGAKASAYAEQLLRVAAEMPAVRYAAAAIAMARPSKLEGRLLAILDAKRDRRAMTWRAGLLVVLLAAALAVPLAMVRAENAQSGAAATTRVAAAQTTQRESEARAAILARLNALQNLSAEFDEVQQFQPRFGLPARDPRRSHQIFSFLHGDAKWNFALDPQSIKLDDQFVSHLITYRNGHVEMLDQMRDPGKPYAYVGDTLTGMEMPVLEVGLGLSAMSENFPDWMTPEKIAGMTLTFDQANRPTLTQLKPYGTAAWTFAPDHGYALVKCSGVSHFGNIVADDFRVVNGIAMPFAFTQKLVLGDGTEDQSWTVTVKSYAIDDPKNTPDRYWLKWPKGIDVDNQRAGIYVKTTADGQILDEKTLASLPLVGVHPLPVGLTKLPEPIEQSEAKEMPARFELNEPSIQLSDPKLVGPIKLPESKAPQMPTPYRLDGPGDGQQMRDLWRSVAATTREARAADPPWLPPASVPASAPPPATVPAGGVTVKQDPGSIITLYLDNKAVRMRMAGKVIEAAEFDIQLAGSLAKVVDVHDGMVRLRVVGSGGNFVQECLAQRIKIGADGGIFGEGGIVPPTDDVSGGQDAPPIGASAAAALPDNVPDNRVALRVLSPGGSPMQIEKIRQLVVWTKWGPAGASPTESQPKVLQRFAEGWVFVDAQMFGLATPHARTEITFISDGHTIHAEATLPFDSREIEFRSMADPNEVNIDQTTGPAAGPDEIAGRVVDPHGQPVAGAVFESTEPEVARKRFPFGVWETTDANGIFRLAHVSANPVYHLFYELHAAGYATRWIGDLPVGRGFTVHLFNNTRVRGNLLLPGGAPASGAKLRLTTSKETVLQNYGNFDFTATTVADAAGAYDLPLEPGIYQAVITSPSGASANLSNIAIPSGSIIALPPQLNPGASLTLRLVDRLTGKPVAGAHLAIEKRSPGWILNDPATERVSDADGRVHWDNLVPGQTSFDVRADGYARWSLQNNPVKVEERGIDAIFTDVPTGSSEMKVLMEPAIRITGQVLAPDGTPVPGAIVNVAGMRTGDNRYARSADAQGRFSLQFANLPTPDNKYAIVGCDPKERWAHGLSPWFTPAAGLEKTFTIQLTPGGRMHGRVIDAAGKPVPRIEVVAVNPDGADCDYYNPRALTDGQGQYELPPMRPGDYQLYPSTSFTTRIDPPPGYAPPLIHIEEAQTITPPDLIDDGPPPPPVPKWYNHQYSARPSFLPAAPATQPPTKSSAAG